MNIAKEFTFDAAHRLPMVPEGHKCATMHGHTYRVRIDLEGSMNQRLGWVVDFGAVKSVWDKLVGDRLDHQTLNDIAGLGNPTAEVLCWWMFTELSEYLPQLERVEVWETASSSAALAVDEFREVTGAP